MAADEAYGDQYARTREVQADTLFDEILDIADDGRNEWIEKHDQDGEAIGYRENGEPMRRSELRINARKWMVGKLRPKSTVKTENPALCLIQADQPG